MLEAEGVLVEPVQHLNEHQNNLIAVSYRTENLMLSIIMFYEQIHSLLNHECKLSPELCIFRQLNRNKMKFL